MLTAAAASLGLILIAREIFWGPMAYAMMGGIIVGTVLTLLFLPALYVAWFRIKEPDAATHADSKAGLGQPAIVESYSRADTSTQSRRTSSCACYRVRHWQTASFV